MRARGQRRPVALELAQQRLHADQPPVQNLLRNLQQVLPSPDRSPHSASPPRSSSDDDPARAQPRQLLRHDRLIDAEAPLQVLHAALWRRTRTSRRRIRIGCARALKNSAFSV